MTRSRRKLIETLVGKGAVLSGDEPRADVLYRVNVYQESILAGDQWLDGLKDASGSIHVVNGSFGLMDDNLYLRFEDKRRVRIFPRQQTSESDWRIQCSGDWFTT